MKLSMRVQAKDGTKGTVVDLRPDGMIQVEWDEWQDWCYPEYDQPTTYEFLDEFTIVGENND